MRNFVALLILAFFGAAVQADTIYSYEFSGTVSSENFAAPPSALTTAAGGSLTGQPFLLSFNDDVSYYNEVQDIVASFPDLGITYTVANDGFPEIDPDPSDPQGEYRWNATLPGTDTGFTMIFWFTTSEPGVVTYNPVTLNTNDFNGLHEFDIVNSSGSEAVDVQLSNYVPLPASALMGTGLLSLLAGTEFFRRRYSKFI